MGSALRNIVVIGGSAGGHDAVQRLVAELPADEDIQAALWTAVSALQEKAAVLRQMAQRAESLGNELEHRQRHGPAGRAWQAGEVLRAQRDS